MLDLLYLGDAQNYDKLWKQMKHKWPNAVLQDASDFIHLYRFSIELDINEDEYLLSGFVNNFFTCSLFCELTRLEKPKKYLEAMREVVHYLENKNT